MFVSLSRKSFTFLKCGTERFFFRNFYYSTVSPFHPLRLSRYPIPPYQPLQHSYSFPPQNHCKSGIFSQRLDFLSTQSDPPKSSTGDVPDNKVSLVQRFKNAYKVYGKVLIVVHGVTSVAWLGLFYLIAYSGLDVISVLRSVKYLDWVIEPMLAHGLGLWATALILYKLNTPFRYLATLAVTRFVVRLMRSRGMAPHLTEEDRLRNLARQGVRLSRKRIIQSSDRMRARLRSVSYNRQSKKPLS
ncbi:unnamed protein product [Hymenolepis diminuta]|uniref:DUF1279 domain-containing protein n=1 Tax=Hymenolepis diminuta TaxID=6216 RepID=A0A0R3SJ47_HYMDI|nr:unnamed protein product [Hymenolepis diminuta]